MSGVRCFAALALPADLQTLLRDVRLEIGDADSRWAGEKWVAPDNLHITLKFFGDIPDEALSDLSSELGEAVAASPAFELPVSKIRPVPSRRRASMLWATFDDPDGFCAELAAAVDRTGVGFGVASDERAFRPHATLVRARRPHAVTYEALSRADDLLGGAQPVSVTSATFLASTLTGKGPVYRDISSHPLGGDASSR